MKRQHTENGLQSVVERNEVLNLKLVSEGTILSWWGLELPPVIRMTAATFVSHAFCSGPEGAAAESPGCLGLVKAWQGMGYSPMALGLMLGREKLWPWIGVYGTTAFCKNLLKTSLSFHYAGRESLDPLGDLALLPSKSKPHLDFWGWRATRLWPSFWKPLPVRSGVYHALAFESEPNFQIWGISELLLLMLCPQGTQTCLVRMSGPTWLLPP